MRRVNQVLREVVGEAIASELSDPRLDMVAVTSVDTSPDLRSARVYVTVLGDDQAKADALDALKSAHSLLQSRINGETHMKRTPTLSFEYDESIETGMRISALLEAESGEGPE
ncbi:MAG: 30S ribosome-binding factor RbfA [Thermoleophilia bacterium]|nr:30S ribosome-binding factor RbfA [Thermoleophilia bacterium]